MHKIKTFKAREIISSTGTPTLEVDVILDSGIVGRSSVSAGKVLDGLEPIDLRDEDSSRYFKKGLLKNIELVKDVIEPCLKGLPVHNQRILDAKLQDLDGTDRKKYLGANTMLAVSCAIADAAAKSLGIPLYRYLGGASVSTMPVPLFNILNCGIHGDGLLDAQEVMIAPLNAPNFKEAVRIGSEIFYYLKEAFHQSGYIVNIGDEGGYVGTIGKLEIALDLIQKATEKAGYIFGTDVKIGLDFAATLIFKNEKYHLPGSNISYDTEELIKYYIKLVGNYPIFSLEDPLASSDEGGWRLITKELGHKIQIVGDRYFCSSKSKMKEATSHSVANAVLIKPNQIGTVSEVIDAIQFAHKNGYRTIVSQRTSETEDNFISHLAVALGSSQIKAGSLARSERTGKYNELLRIEEELELVENYFGALLNENQKC
jgi:enolase